MNLTVFIRFCYGASVGFIVGPVIWTAYILLISLIWPGVEASITFFAIAACAHGLVCGAIIGIYDLGLGKSALVSYSLVPAYFIFMGIVLALVGGLGVLIYVVLYAGAFVVLTVIPNLILGFLVSDINYRITGRYILRRRQRLLKKAYAKTS